MSEGERVEPSQGGGLMAETPSPDPVLSKVAAERDHYKQRVEEAEADAKALDEELTGTKGRLTKAHRLVKAAEQRVEELEAALELIAGHESEPYRDPAGDIARLALLDQTDERKSEPFIPAVDTRDLVPASLLSEIADVATGCLTRASGELTEQQMVFFEPLQELLRDHSTPEEGK